MNNTVNPIHIAFYMQDLSGGGVERMRLALIGALRDGGAMITLVLGQRIGPLESDLPPDLSIVDLQSTHVISQIPGLIKFLSRYRPDIVVSSLDHNNIAAMIAHAWAKDPARLVICQHNALSAEGTLGWKYRIVPLAYRVLHRFADAIVAVSRGVANDLSQVAGLPRSKISVIYNPVIGPDFELKSNSIAPHHWFVNRPYPVFVFIGRLTQQKDAFTLLLAMQWLLRRQDARLIIVGTGAEAENLRRMAIHRKIDQAVDFVGFQTNPLPWIKHADALVSSSRFEGLGNAIIEALGCGTAVIATNCPHGPAEILLEGALGTLVPVGDFEALAEAMAQVRETAFDKAAMKARARGFTTSACAKAHMRLFERLLDSRKPFIRALGMEFSSLSVEQVAENIVKDRNARSVKLMVTPNIDHVRLLQRQAFSSAYATAHLICPDGFPVLIYAWLHGLSLTTRVTGCDILSEVIHHPDLFSHRIYFVVESHKTFSAARAWFARRGLNDKIEIALARPGLAGDAKEQNDLVQRIYAFSPTILVITLGAPFSEEFAHLNRHSLPHCWILCVGQALRVHLGLARRAPALWRHAGLEWFWRLCCEPSRLSGRYARSLLWFPRAVWLDACGRLHLDKGERGAFLKSEA